MDVAELVYRIHGELPDGEQLEDSNLEVVVSTPDGATHSVVAVGVNRDQLVIAGAAVRPGDVD